MILKYCNMTTLILIALGAFGTGALLVVMLVYARILKFRKERRAKPSRMHAWRGKVFGHRGCHMAGIPENSLASVEYADKHNDQAEFPVRCVCQPPSLPDRIKRDV
eukprot:112127_1